MTDAEHEALERAAHDARERLVASLEQLDTRAKTLVQGAAETTRASAVGVAGAMLVWFAVSFAAGARHRERGRMPSRSAHAGRSTASAIAGTALKVGAVALVFVGARAWAAATQRARTPQPYSSAPQLGRPGGAVVSDARQTLDVTPTITGTQNASTSATTTPQAAVEVRDHHD
jgi:hypothetical protein